MSRSGYSDDCDNEWSAICWRGAVASAIRGRRGQAFLREMAQAMDAMPEKKLFVGEIVAEDGGVCAIGSVAIKRGVDTKRIDPEDRDQVAAVFGISPAMAAEIAYMNDEYFEPWREELPPEERWKKVRAWVESKIIKEEVKP
jgi:hypothetical protein